MCSSMWEVLFFFFDFCSFLEEERRGGLCLGVLVSARGGLCLTCVNVVCRVVLVTCECGLEYSKVEHRKEEGGVCIRMSCVEE